MKKENEVVKITRTKILEIIVRDLKRILLFWNILFYINTALLGLEILAKAGTFDLLLPLTMMILCYFYIRKNRKLLDTLLEVQNGPGNSGEAKTESTKSDKPT